MTDARTRLARLLMKRCAQLETGTGRCGVSGYPDLVCAGWAGHQPPHYTRDGWHWTGPDHAWREKPDAAKLPHWDGVLPPAVAGGWTRPWCHQCSKPVSDVKRIPLSDGRTAVTVLCHDERQSVVATQAELGRIREWMTAFEPGYHAILQLSKALPPAHGPPYCPKHGTSLVERMVPRNVWSCPDCERERRAADAILVAERRRLDG